MGHARSPNLVDHDVVEADRRVERTDADLAGWNVRGLARGFWQPARRVERSPTRSLRARSLRAPNSAFAGTKCVCRGDVYCARWQGGRGLRLPSRLGFCVIAALCRPLSPQSLQMSCSRDRTSKGSRTPKAESGSLTPPLANASQAGIELGLTCQLPAENGSSPRCLRSVCHFLAPERHSQRPHFPPSARQLPRSGFDQQITCANPLCRELAPPFGPASTAGHGRAAAGIGTSRDFRSAMTSPSVRTGAPGSRTNARARRGIRPVMRQSQTWK